MSNTPPCILVLEDRAIDRLFLKTLLGYRGFTVLEAGDGEQGLAIATTTALDLVISDVLMPKMDGFQFVRELRRHPSGRDVPVIFYTATYHEAEARALADECGVVDLMIKPSEPEVILARVDAVLARGGPRAGAIADAQFMLRHSRLTSDKLIERTHDLEASERRMAALVQLGQRLIEEHDPVALLNRVCGIARDATAATYAMVGLFNDAGDRLPLVFTSGHGPEAAERLRGLTQLPEPMAAIARDRRPIRGRTPHGQPQYLTWHPPVSSYLLVPLMSRNRALGLLAVAEKASGADFTDADEQVAMTLAMQAAMAYENALLINQLETQAATLRDREATTEFALSTAGIGVYTRALPGGTIQASNGVRRMFGLPADAPLDDLYTMVDRSDVERARDIVDRAIASCSDFQFEFRIVADPANVRHIHARGQVEAGGDGQARRLLNVLIDMTERRELAEQLRQAQKMEAIGQLAGGVAHDFNNLLTVIMGHARLLEETTDDEQARDINAIVTAGERAAGLTRQLLSFSRKQAREITLFDLNTQIREVVGMLRRLIGENIRLETALTGSPAIENDRGQIEQILMNLVVNARDAMPSGGVVTIATATERIDGSEWVRLTVSDNGTGMTDEVRRHIFEPFFTTKPIGQGTGLGLATVFSIINQSHGHLTVDSTVGEGTAFNVFLPRAAALIVPAPVAERRSPRGNESVLIVEDDDAIRELMRQVLVKAGYAVEVAVNPAEALIVAKRRDFDLLVTDVLMPGGTGPALYGELASSHPLLRVVYVSGYAPDTVLDSKVLDARAAFLGKPFAPSTFTQKIREVLER
jgi:signal transduction histidine kinase/DNA-binding response OmpR family regulator